MTKTKQRVIQNRTCHWCGESFDAKDVEFRQFHEGECERCPEGKCKCTKKLKYYWSCQDCMFDGESCCRFYEDDDDDDE